MRLLWEERAWEEYCYWQTQNKKVLKRINIYLIRKNGCGCPLLSQKRYENHCNVKAVPQPAIHRLNMVKRRVFQSSYKNPKQH